MENVVLFLKQHMKGRLDSSVALTQVTKAGKNELPVGSFSKSPCTVIFLVISYISPGSDTQLQNINVRTQLGET